jgi:hypothetical protein
MQRTASMTDRFAVATHPAEGDDLRLNEAATLSNAVAPGGW